MSKNCYLTMGFLTMIVSGIISAFFDKYGINDLSFFWFIGHSSGIISGVFFTLGIK